MRDQYRKMLRNHEKYNYNLGYVEALQIVQSMIEEIIADGFPTNTTNRLQRQIHDLEVAKVNEDWFE